MEHHVQPFIHHYLESLGPLGNRPSGLWRCRRVYERVYLMMHSCACRVHLNTMATYTPGGAWYLPSYDTMSAVFETYMCWLLYAQKQIS